MFVCRCTACSVPDVFSFHVRILDCTLRFNVCQEPVELDILPVCQLCCCLFHAKTNLFSFFGLGEGTRCKRRSYISTIRSPATFRRAQCTVCVLHYRFSSVHKLNKPAKLCWTLRCCFLNIKGNIIVLKPVIIYIKCCVCISLLWQTS